MWIWESHDSVFFKERSPGCAYNLSPLCGLVFFFERVSESSSPATVSSRSMEISTWVLTSLPTLPPHSPIAMETLMSSLSAWWYLSETCNASQWTSIHSDSKLKLTNQILSPPLLFSPLPIIPCLHLLCLGSLKKVLNFSWLFFFPQCVVSNWLWTSLHSAKEGKKQGDCAHLNRRGTVR